MCTENNENRCNCLSEIVEHILKLQNYTDGGCDNAGCDKPFLGPTPALICYNTRPVNFYRCCNGTRWELPYTDGELTGTSSTFRLESIEGCCVTARILRPAGEGAANPYIATSSYFTINLNCVGAIKCLPDVYVPCN